MITNDQIQARLTTLEDLGQTDRQRLNEQLETIRRVIDADRKVKAGEIEDLILAISRTQEQLWRLSKTVEEVIPLLNQIAAHLELQPDRRPSRWDRMIVQAKKLMGRYDQLSEDVRRLTRRRP